MQQVPALVWCLLSSLLLWLSFFPMNIGWLGWVALVPLIFVLEKHVKGEPVQRWWNRPLLCAWLGGLIFCLAAFRWITLASPPMIVVYVLVSLIISLQWYFFFQFSRLMTVSLRVPLILSAAISWTAMEYLRSQIWIGYSWYYLAHTQHDELAFIQLADITGVYGLSFILVMVSVGLARTLAKQSLRVACLELVPAVVCVGLACWYGSSALSEDASQLARPQSPRLGLLQGNQPQDLRNDPEKWKKIDITYSELGSQAATHQPAMIITPETCLSFTWIRLANNIIPESALKKYPRIPEGINLVRQWISHHTQTWQADFLCGFNCFDYRTNVMRHTNSAVLFNKAGEEMGCYDKIVCLPFGEYIPWAETLPFMKWLSPYEYEYTIRPGTELKSLTWNQFKLGLLICYEDTAHDHVRGLMLHNTPNFFVNISNDGWFKGSEEHEQHLVSSRFRCIENRRSMVRSVNMGVSCIIDAMGRIIALPAKKGGSKEAGQFAGNIRGSEWREAINREGILVGSVPLYTQISLYTRWGDILPWVCWAVMVAAFVVSWLNRPKRSAPHEATPAAAEHPVRG